MLTASNQLRSRVAQTVVVNAGIVKHESQLHAKTVVARGERRRDGCIIGEKAVSAAVTNCADENSRNSAKSQD